MTKLLSILQKIKSFKNRWRIKNAIESKDIVMCCYRDTIIIADNKTRRIYELSTDEAGQYKIREVAYL